MAKGPATRTSETKARKRGAGKSARKGGRAGEAKISGSVVAGFQTAARGLGRTPFRFWSAFSKERENLGNARKTVVNFALLVTGIPAAAVLLVALGLSLYEAFADQRFGDIETIQVPKSLRDRGYTGDVVADHLVDGLYEINRGSPSFRDKKSFRLPRKHSPIRTIRVRILGITVSGVTSSIAQFFGSPPTRITGEITLDHAVCASPESGKKDFAGDRAKRTRLRLRLGTTKIDVCIGPKEDLDELFARGARAIVKEVDPYTLAVYHYRKKDKKQAEALIKYTIKSDPKNSVWAYNLWGVILAGENPDGAIGKFKQAIDADPKFAGAYINRSVVYSRKKQYHQAIADLNRAIELMPDSAAAYNNRAMVYLEMGRWAKGLGQWAKSSEQWAKGLRDAKCALTLDMKKAHKAVVYETRARIYVALGRPEDAIRDYREALRLDPKTKEAIAGLKDLSEVKVGPRRRPAPAGHILRLWFCEPQWPDFFRELSLALLGAGGEEAVEGPAAQA